jgi:hypothetical protein
MADYLPAPTFNLQYTTPLTDIGKGYAEGITSAGKSIGSAITGIMGGVNEKGEVVQGILGQQRTVDDTLAAMHEANMLTPEQYKAVAGKGLGAKTQLLGTFANEWIQQQANERALALAKGKTSLEIGAKHAELLDQVNLIKTQGVTPQGKIVWKPQTQTQTQPQTQTQADQNQQLTAPPVVAGTGTANVAYVPGSQKVQLKDTEGNIVWALKTADGKYYRIP